MRRARRAVDPAVLAALLSLTVPAARAPAQEAADEAGAGAAADTAAVTETAAPAERAADPADPAAGEAAPGPAVADTAATVVDGFRGYVWGTARSEIPEIAGVEPATAPNGMSAYRIDADLLGHGGVAFYLFDPESDELLEGIYVLEIEMEQCDPAWETLETRLAEMHPGLAIERVKSEWLGAEKSVYDTFCEFFVFNPSTTNWITRWRNEVSGLVELGMAIRPQALEPRLSVLYVSPAAAHWEMERVRAAADSTAVGEAPPDSTPADPAAVDSGAADTAAAGEPPADSAPVNGAADSVVAGEPPADSAAEDSPDPDAPAP